MEAFATHEDLAKRLNRTFTPDEEAWVTTLLEDAADFMRGVMRNQVYPSSQSTYVAYPAGGRVDLPQGFVRSVDSVKRDDTDVPFVRREDSVFVDGVAPVSVTFTYGLSAAPGDLVSINCALVSQMMLTVQAGLGLSGGGLSSVAIDDFKAAFADGGSSTGLSLSEHTRAYLEERYGRTSWVVDLR